MTTKNKNSGRQETTPNSSFGILFLLLNIYVCILLFASFSCNTAFGETESDEIYSTLLLTIGSQQQEQELTDIQIASHAELLTLPSERMTSYLAAGSSKPAGAITINFAAEVNNTQPQNTPSSADTSPKKLEQQVWDSRITALPQDHDKNKTNELRQLVEQVRSVKFEPHRPAQQPAALLVETPRPAVTAPLMQPAEPAKTAEINDEQTLKIVDKQLKDPNQISNPFELAEILFKSGRLSQAGICYKQALKLLPVDDPNAATERAWILFQIGNCLKDEDPNTARESYAELIRTHSDSPWAELAKARYGLIEWEQQDHPGELVRQTGQTNNKGRLTGD